MRIIVDGTVPQGSGLSSSSALTCATAVAVMAAHNLSFTKAEVADFTCKCERHSGTQSGGMDGDQHHGRKWCSEAGGFQSSSRVGREAASRRRLPDRQLSGCEQQSSDRASDTISG